MNADLRGDAVTLSCADSDAALRALLGQFPAARDIEVLGAGLEEAFMALTADDNDDRPHQGGPMTSTVYVRYEVLRNFRNWRFFFLALAFPLVLYFIDRDGEPARPLQRHRLPAVLHGRHGHAGHDGRGHWEARRSSPPNARPDGPARCGSRRSRTGAYFGAKVLNAYLRALLTIALMCLAGTALGVRLSAAEWLTVIGLLLVGLVPFTVLGILLGHLIGPDASALAVGGIVTLFALLGGVYGFQIATSGPVFDVIKALPSYWLVQAGKTALGHGSWPAEGWIVIAVWTAVLTVIAVFVYQRAGSQTS